MSSNVSAVVKTVCSRNLGHVFLISCLMWKDKRELQLLHMLGFQENLIEREVNSGVFVLDEGIIGLSNEKRKHVDEVNTRQIVTK